MERWVVVPNWEKFQHGHKRDHPWIKLYTRLAHKPEWEELSLGARGMLVTIWLEYAASGGRCSVEAVRKQCGRSYKAATLESLVQAGFVALRASTEEVLRTSKRAGGENGSAAADPEEEKEPLRDPEALTKIRQLAAGLGSDRYEL